MFRDIQPGRVPWLILRGVLMNIREYIGLDYEDRGRGPNAFDCLGFVSYVFRRELNIDLPDFLDTYRSAEDSSGVAAAINKRKVDWERVDNPRPLDLILFNVLGHPTHVGLFISNDDFLHCFKGTGSCLERLNSLTWGRRVLGFYRWKG